MDSDEESSPPRLIWTVYLERNHEQVWRETLGQEDMDEWCSSYGLSANEVVSGTVVMFGYDNGAAFLNAELFLVDEEGRKYLVPETDIVATKYVILEMKQSLPEGIGNVVRV